MNMITFHLTKHNLLFPSELHIIRLLQRCNVNSVLLQLNHASDCIEEPAQSKLIHNIIGRTTKLTRENKINIISPVKTTISMATSCSCMSPLWGDKSGSSPLGLMLATPTYVMFYRKVVGIYSLCFVH